MRRLQPWMVWIAASSIHWAACSKRCTQLACQRVSMRSRNCCKNASVGSPGCANACPAWTKRCRIRSRNSAVAASVKVMTKICGGSNGDPKLACEATGSRRPNTMRRYRALKVQVLPVPALASITCRPCSGSAKGSSTVGVFMRHPPGGGGSMPGRPARGRKNVRSTQPSEDAVAQNFPNGGATQG